MACVTEDGSGGGKFKGKANFSSNFFQEKRSTSLHRFNLIDTSMLTSWHLSSRPSAPQCSVCNSACFPQLFKIPSDPCTKEFLNGFSVVAEPFITFPTVTAHLSLWRMWHVAHPKRSEQNSKANEAKSLGWKYVHKKKNNKKRNQACYDDALHMEIPAPTFQDV